MQLSSVSYLLSLSPKYTPQRPILVRPQPMFLPKRGRPSFTPYNKRQNLQISVTTFLDSKQKDISCSIEYSHMRAILKSGNFESKL